MKYEFWTIDILSLGFLVTKEFTMLIDVLLTCHLYSSSQVRERYKISFFVGSGRSGNAVLGKKRVSEKAFVSNGTVLKARENRAPAFLSINFKTRVGVRLASSFPPSLSLSLPFHSYVGYFDSLQYLFLTSNIN